MCMGNVLGILGILLKLVTFFCYFQIFSLFFEKKKIPCSLKIKFKSEIRVYGLAEEIQ